jgi:preprotein translocase subunit SecA
MITTPEGKAEWEEMLAKFKAQTDKEHDEVIALGGLHILGTERHESRRIDNQLRGRAGRQGDPGSSRFYLSLQDDLLRIFGGDKMQNLMLRLGMEEDVPIESGMITKRIAAAQQAVEVQNFESRKHLLEYDDVMNKQRTAVYKLRRDLLEGLDQKEHVLEMTRGALAQFIDIRCPEGAHPTTFDFSGLRNDVMNQFGLKADSIDFTGMSREEVEETLYEQLVQKYQQKEDLIGSDIMRQTERMIMLQVVDDQWKDHLLSMDHLKEGIGLRGSGPKETIRILFTFTFEQGRPQSPFGEANDSEYEEEAAEPEPTPEERKAAQAVVQDFTKKIERDKNREMQQLQFVGGGSTATVAQPIIKGDKVGRNDPCPCGSGKKYKKCHGTDA